MEKETEINDAPAWYRKAMDVPYEDHMVNVEGHSGAGCFGGSGVVWLNGGCVEFGRWCGSCVGRTHRK